VRLNSLATRLLALMWGALIGSHLTAWLVVHQLLGRGPMPPGPPTLGELPPADLPLNAQLLDYGVRLVVLALAAWWGSRWLARPVAELAAAADALPGALARGQAPAPLDETRGSHEVRTAAAVFNRMAHEATAQFQARGLLTAAISHDLRTPLTRLRLRLEQPTPEAVAACVADIQEMNALIDTTLEAFGPVPEASLAPLDAGALVQALIDDLADTGAAADFAATGGPAIVRAEPLLLRRAVGNLLGNALRYGRVAHARVHAEPGRVVITVLDEGPGIAPEHLARVRQPYVRLEASRHRGSGGTGLGLFIADEAAQRLGGRLALANRLEGGLAATLTLPAYTAAP